MSRSTNLSISNCDDWLPPPESWPVFACQRCEAEMRVPFPPSDRLCGDCRAKENPKVEKTLEQRLADVGTPRKYERCTRERWQGRQGPWSESPILRGLVDWPDQNQTEDADPSSWLVFIISPGYSDRKTELGTAVLGEAISPGRSGRRGLRGRWSSQCAWLRDIKASWHGKGGEGSEHPIDPEHVVWRRAADAEVLLFDNFGGGDGFQSSSRSWWRSQVTELLHYRECHLLPTIVTANLADWRQVRHVHESLVQRMDVPLKIVLPQAGGRGGNRAHV